VKPRRQLQARVREMPRRRCAACVRSMKVPRAGAERARRAGGAARGASARLQAFMFAARAAAHAQARGVQRGRKGAPRGGQAEQWGNGAGGRRGAPDAAARVRAQAVRSACAAGGGRQAVRAG